MSCPLCGYPMSAHKESIDGEMVYCPVNADEVEANMAVT